MQKGSFFLGKSSPISHIGLLGICFLSLAAGTGAECPVQISPQSVVVKYFDSFKVNCSTSVTHQGMGWESTKGAVPLSKDSLIILSVSQLIDWEIQPPFCYINYDEKQCSVDLPVTVYKTPDSVSISTVNPIMIEGNQYELQCDVHNVAPAQNLTVNWYKGETLVNQTSFTDITKSPVNITSKLLIHPDRTDDGAQYRCEAELNLGEAGPQPPPKNTSEPLSITVYFQPTINEDILPSIVYVVRGYSEMVVCKAEGKPKPTISWSDGTNTVNGETFTITESTAENLTCTATNAAGSSSRSVKVVIQENIMPIIIGIVCGILLVISVIFIYIYITCYKKNKMGHYNFKKPKTPKGLLAQPAQTP